MREPRNVTTTSEKSALKSGPMAMPTGGGGAPKPIGNLSTTVSLNHKAIPVANLSNKASMGTFINKGVSATASLSRQATSPYDGVSATMPALGFGGGKRGRK